MVIKASASAEIRTLVDALRTGDGVKREAAIARLNVIGPRAVDRLIAAYRESDRAGRRAILRALEPMADPRALALARGALGEDPDLAADAAAVLQRLMTSAADSAAGALDALMSAALDPTAAPAVRLAASEALGDVPADLRARIADVISTPPRAATRRRPAGAQPPPIDTVWTDALDGRLPPAPEPLRRRVAAHAAAAPLTSLQKLVDLVRVREDGAADEEDWRRLRGALHQALALRGSRVALYDLRETFERTTTPLPVAFLAAVEANGDASCLEPLAAAWSRADASEGWWRDHLAAAFRAIVSREKLTRRSPAMKKVLAKWPAPGPRGTLV